MRYPKRGSYKDAKRVQNKKLADEQKRISENNIIHANSPFRTDGWCEECQDYCYYDYQLDTETEGGEKK